MLIFWVGWLPEMSLWESGSTKGWLGENTKPPLRLFNIFLTSQASTMGQRRYDPRPQNIKSMQQCIQCKIQVSYRMWVPGTGFSVSSHSAATLSKFITPLQNPIHADIMKGLGADESQASRGWHYVGSDFNSHCFFSIKNIQDLCQFYWMLLQQTPLVDCSLQRDLK